MKKLFLAIIAFSFIAQASAQKFGGGLEVGVSYNWLNIDSKNAEATGGRIGFNYGAFLDMNLSDNFAFTTGLNVNNIGGTVKYDNPINLTWDGVEYAWMKDGTENPEVFYKVSYLEIPLSIKGKTEEIGYITYFGRLGASPSLAISSKADIIHGKAIESTNDDGSFNYVKDKEDLSIGENINLFNIGWHVGGGIEYSLGGSTSVIVEALYQQNFLSVVDDNVTGTYPTVGVKNSLIVLKAGIKF